MEVHNMMEDIVKNCLQELIHQHRGLAESDIKNQSDILAIALNKLPPRYVSSAKGEMFAKTQLKAQVETDVYQELIKAIEVVMPHFTFNK